MFLRIILIYFVDIIIIIIFSFHLKVFDAVWYYDRVKYDTDCSANSSNLNVHIKFIFLIIR